MRADREGGRAKWPAASPRRLASSGREWEIERAQESPAGHDGIISLSWPGMANNNNNDDDDDGGDMIRTITIIISGVLNTLKLNFLDRRVRPTGATRRERHFEA